MEQKRAKIAANPVRRWFRRGMATLAVTAALVSVFGSAAQANMPWDDAENTITNIMNVCRPNDSPGLGTNDAANRDISATVVPQYVHPEAGGKGLDRLSKGLATAHIGTNTSTPQNGLSLVAGVKDQGFNRYGYGSLQWDNFGSTCFTGPGQLLNGPSNALLTIAVNGPAVLLTALINFALYNQYYAIFFGMVNPFMELFAQVLSPWVTMIVLIGGTITILLRSKGSLTRILQLSCWMLAILGLFFGIQTQGLGKQITDLANNSVTQASNLIACQVVTANVASQNVVSSGGSCGTMASVDPNKTSTTSSSFKITGGIDQAIWYSIPYQVWSMGAVGSTQYNDDHARETGAKPYEKVELSWSAAMLNAKHTGSDAVGDQVKQYTEKWNQAGYASKGKVDGQKVRIWTDPADNGWDATTDDGGDSTRVWNRVPYLGLVKALCNDTAYGNKESDKPEDNKWLYQGTCDTAGAGVNFLPAFKGDYFWERGAAITSGAFSIIAVFIPLAGVSLYLMGQKTVFFFILLFAPIFLAIGAFPDEKRMGFAKKYFEFFIANLVKQVVAVCVLLFVMTGVSGVLTSPASIWWLKPIAVVMFTYGLVLFAIPLANILKAAAKGDVSIVEKTLTAPQRAAKGAAKLAGMAAIATATMGMGALAAGGAAAAGAAGAAGAASGSGVVGAAGAAVGRKGLGALVRNGAGVMKTGAKAFASVAMKGGAKGAAQNLTQMVKSGEAMRLLRYTGLNGTPVGNMLRDGVGISQLGLKLMARQDKSEDAATLQGKANARELGIKQLDQADYSGAKKYERDAGGRLTGIGRQEAAADYEKYFAGDPEGDKAKQASAQALGNFHANYEKMTGEKLPTDPGHPSNRGSAPTQQETAQTITDQIPSSSWQTAVVPNVVREGSSILQAVGGTDALFSGVQTTTTLDKIFESYGTMANIDPTHPAMSAMAQFGFAMQGTDTELQSATFQASMELIKEHGLPDKIQGINASPEFAENFSPATVLSMAPNLTSSSTLSDRVEAAGIFTVASMAVPSGSLIAPSVDALREALWNPESQADHINELKSALANSVAMADVRNPFFSASDASFAMPTSDAQKSPEWTGAQPTVSVPTVEFANVGAPTQAAAPAFSAAEAAPTATTYEAQAPMAPAVVQPVFSAASPEREFVQPQYRETPTAPVFVESTAPAPRHAAPQSNGATAAEVRDQINQAMAKQRDEIAAIFGDTADKVQQQSRDDEAAHDYELKDSGRARRSSGLFSAEGDDK
jgi:hypothetical protein